MTRSGLVSTAIVSPAIPVEAEATAYPSSPSERMSSGRIRGSSSMISTCATRRRYPVPRRP